ncbi:MULTISPECIES: bifunctional riboflavin kinase/FAD synthetase [Gordonia]|uniref:bifunctional riboflavin kinase/FAD synthetase n=1 Tax=Gordonia TaxID=2053 RepID=UPI0009DA20B2|nr:MULTISPECIES: bifunctional riboflavin kinase/FAD synthetase [Gordonia]AUH69256.1 bifunctional riboflavin kinase/FAD synthetase [Gordonia sp. YC-JH1]MBY4569788.1 riboflavin biosynthesis protein RibF [Gordonia sihwensis]WFN94446.1 bifunctional riboflavin kinase/FAD synthetase [Gordonia sihwensis]
MLRWRGLDDIPAGWGRCVVTIGVFDGIHRGHAQLVAAATKAAAERGVPSVLMTFDPHPSSVVRSGAYPPQLSTLRRRADLAEEMGIDVFCVIPFSATLAAQSPEDFVHSVLVEELHAAEVVVGDNFTFGHKALGDVPKLRELGERFGFEVTAISLFGEHAVTFSSTYIRSCIAAGDVELAAEALGRPHRVEGVVVHGERRGRDLGFPTANVAPPEHTAIPGDGVYAAWFTVLDSATQPDGVTIGRRYPAAVSVGTNPTFSGRVRTVEAYVLDVEADLYGQHVAVDFVARLRGMEPFDSVDALIAEMNNDVERTRTLLRAE